MSDHTAVVIWVLKIFCVFLPPLLNIFLVFHTIYVLNCAHICMKCSFGITNFLEEICSLSHSIIFLYFLALITEEGFLISLLAILWNSAFKWVYLSFSSSPLASLLFSAICKSSSDNHICPLPLEPPSHLPPHPTTLGCYRALD